MGDDDTPSLQPTVDASNPEVVREAALQSTLRGRQSREFWRGVMSSEIGREEVWKLLDDAHAFAERFAIGPSGFPQPEHTWFEAGQQAFGYRLFLTMMKHDPEHTLLMLSEHESRVYPDEAPSSAKKPRRKVKTPSSL